MRTLAWAKYPSLLFSGALDRHISVWDVYQPNPEAPLLNLDLEKADDWGGMNNEGGERGSVYALGTGQSVMILGDITLTLAQIPRARSWLPEHLSKS